jgi:hypothetical protein
MTIAEQRASEWAAEQPTWPVVTADRACPGRRRRVRQGHLLSYHGVLSRTGGTRTHPECTHGRWLQAQRAHRVSSTTDGKEFIWLSSP